MTVTGGKLTTFRQVARQALEAVCGRIDGADTDEGKSRLDRLHEDAPVLNPVEESSPELDALSEDTRRRLLGRYGSDAVALVAAAAPEELEHIAGVEIEQAAARAEAVAHLDDLLLRRSRLGLLLADGGATHLPHIRRIVQSELDWDDARWETEETAYRELISASYSLPDRQAIPDWTDMLAQHQVEREVIDIERRTRGKQARRGAGLSLLMVGLFLFVMWLLRRERKQDEHD